MPDIKSTAYSTGEILHKRVEFHDKVRASFTHPALRASLNAELKDGRLFGQDVELGQGVKVAEGAAVLGQTKILQGRIGEGAVVVDCVIRNIEAQAASMLVEVEQLDGDARSETGQLLTDVLIMDGGIVKKIRLALGIKTPDQRDLSFAIRDLRSVTLDELLALSNFEAPYLDGSSARFRQVLRDQSLSELFAQEELFARCTENPILGPIAEHPWESKLVYNPAAIRLQGVTYIVYRAFGSGHISRLGLAWSKDGLRVSGRLPYPIFAPQAEYELAGAKILETRPREKGGCEDPRLALIDDRVYMTYSAYGEVLQIALASIAQEDFIALPQTPQADVPGRWVRHGLMFPGVPDRNAVLFPAKLAGRYLLLHRPMHKGRRDIALSASEKLLPPWPDEFEVIMEIRPDRWDVERVGAGPQVVKTRRGWLFIYHGVGIKRGRRSYMLGVALLDLDDPRRVLYRSPEPVFIPQHDYELYGWAPNVVFASGVTIKGKDAHQVAEDDDEIMIYYGGGDRVIGVASAKLADLIPLK